MSKIIKKQIKRSMPWLIIISLLSVTVAGAVFNLNINFNKLSNWKHIGLNVPEVKANADTATTSVTVRNAAPLFSGLPYESPSSTSTTPVNASSSIAFKATADDPENQNFYLIICSSDSVVASSTGGPPSCGATTFCVSATTTDSAEATCTYNTVNPSHPEIVHWWAFVCDDHSSDADCSSASQGNMATDGGSPFYVNHAPELDYVYTSDNNKDPGGTFTVTATSTDSDITRGEDVITLFVCDTNSWATSTGCGGNQLCTATSTANPSCQFTDVAPTPDGAYTYYAFVMDNFNLAGRHQSKSNTYTINNVAPSIGAVTLNSGANITLNLKNAAEISAVFSSTITDNNTCTDLVSATGTVYYENVSGADSCADNDNTCYQGVACSISGCVAGSALANVTCTTTMAFHAVPTDPGYVNNPYRDYTWLAAVRAFDEALNGLGTSTTGVEVNTSEGLAVTEATIDYGTIRAGQNTGSVNATTTVVNYGNSPLDTLVLVADMTTTTQSIGANNQQWSLVSFTYGAGTAGSSTSAATVDVNAARPTSSADVSDEISWGIGIPAVTPSGDYVGLNTFTATVEDDAGEW